MAEKKFVSIADSFREEGAARGRVEGRVEGERRILLGQVRRRFGSVPEDVVARIEAADAEQLETWAGRILDAKDVQALFAD